MLFPFKRCLVWTLLVVGGSVWAAATVDDTAKDLSGDVTVSVASGDTLTWSGPITGSGTLNKTGAGTLILAADNSATFSGAIKVAAGNVQMDVAGAFGTGPLSSSATATAEGAGFIFNAAGATVPNTMSFTASGGGAGLYNIRCLASTTFEGKITSSPGTLGLIDANEKIVTTFAGPVEIGTDFLFFNTGRIDILPTSTFKIRTLLAYNATTGFPKNGSFHFYGDGSRHTISTVTLKATNFYAENENAFPLASFQWNSAGAGTAIRLLDLQGFNQRIGRLNWNSGHQAGLGVDGCRVLSTGGPATLTLTNGGSTYCQPHGDVTIVLDAVGKTQSFDNRTCYMTGDMVVSNGCVKLLEVQSFSNVPGVWIAPGGKLWLAGTASDAFGGATNVTVEGRGQLVVESSSISPFSAESTVLHVAATSQVTIPAGFEVAVAELYVDGVKQANGVYTKGDLGFLLGDGTLKVQKLTRSAGVWNAGGGDADSIQLAANWSGEAPDLTSGGFEATLVAGSRMTVDADAEFLGLTLDASLAGFDFAGDHILTIGASGVTCAGSGTAQSWSFDCPLALNGSTAWTFPKTDELVFRGGITGAGAMEVSAGFTRLFGENLFSGGLTVKEGTLTLSGTLGVPEDTSTLVQSATTAPLVFSNVVVNKGATFVGGNNKSLTFVAGTTNELNGYLRIAGNFQPVVAPDAKLTIGGEIYFDLQHYVPNANCKGTVEFRQAPYTRNQGNMIRPEAGTHVYSTGSKTWSCATFYATYGTACQTFGCDRFLKLDRSVGDVGHRTGEWNFDSDNGICDLAGTVQWCSAATGTKGLLTSARPATFEVVPYQWNDAKTVITTNSVLGARIDGPVSILFGARKTFPEAMLTLTNRIFASTGDLTVTNGTLVLAKDASWANGTNVYVKTKGVLSLTAASNLNDKIATIWLADEGALAIADGIQQRVAMVLVYSDEKKEFVRVRPGTYSAAAPGALAGRFAASSGTGTLLVRGGGTMVVFR